MKPLTILPLVWLLLWLPSCSLRAQDRKDTEQLKREFTLTGPAGSSTLVVYNIFGSVTVEAYSGSTIVVEATKTISADNAQTLEQGKKEARLGFLQRHDSVVVYVEGPQDSRPHNHSDHGWNDRDIEYHYQFDFVVKVPAQLHVSVSTVNDGRILVQDVTGPLQARNVNGDVTIKNAREATVVRTINGDVDVSNTAAPGQGASYKTINGNIRVSFPATVSADLYFKSMHGELYTDFPKTEVLPARVTQNQQHDGQGTRYKLSKETAVRLGKGGPEYRFETLNGNVTIKQQTR